MGEAGSLREPAADDTDTVTQAGGDSLEHATWRDVPGGYYALPIFGDNDETEFGYVLYERRVPRTTSTGRTIGGHRWRRALVAAEGVDMAELLADDLDDEQFDVGCILRDPDYYRAELGRLTGKCGWCGRRLTDPDSKMCGMGPECARGIR